MLNRQRVVLSFLKAAGRPVLRTELTKWSFLLRNEYNSAGGSAFYDFVPYQAICCHRSRVAQHIADRTSLEVVNLPSGGPVLSCLV